MSTRLRFVILLLTAVAFFAACDELRPRERTDTGTEDTEPDDGDQDERDSAADADTEDDADGTTDADAVVEPLPDEMIETECMGTLTHVRTPGARVVSDLCAWTEATPADAKPGHTASIKQLTSLEERMPGPAAQGQPGDWEIDTGVARFVIQGEDRHPNPCVYGGTIIDASYKRDDGTWTPDNVGEVCLFVQLGRSLDPSADDFEVLMDGSDGGPVVLAVTSVDKVADWINLQSYVDQLFGGAIQLPLNANDDYELTLTHYYVAHPGSNGIDYLTAMRSDRVKTVDVAAGDMVDSGGAVEFFNPESSLGGFGYGDISPEDAPFLAFSNAESSQAYVPPFRGVNPDGSVEVDAQYIAVSGVAVAALGTQDMLGTLLAARLRGKEGIITLERGESSIWERRFYVGDADMATLTDSIYRYQERPVGTVSGTVTAADGAPAPGVRVVALRAVDDALGEQAETRFVTRADGSFGGLVPAGEYRFVVDDPTRIPDTIPTASVAIDGEVTGLDVQLGATGTLRVNVRDAYRDAPIPAKAVVFCNGACARPYSSTLRDVTRENLGASTAAVVHIPTSGTVDIQLPPGDYELVVSRGMAWSVWPPATNGERPRDVAMAVTLPADGTPAVANAELYPAVRTAGWIGADFHVHAVNSPDAPVDNYDRIASLLASGVEVMIATDHDYITDYGPYIEALDATEHGVAMIGVEMTTFDYGHTNAFPLVYDPTDIVGGAVDHAVEDGPPMHPVELFEAVNAFPGDQVVQVNHGNGRGGYFGSIQLDAARFISKTNPTIFRLPAVERGEDGDTGLWTPTFSAMEVLNGSSESKFWILTNYWFAMIANGFTPTATASSDTHRLYSDIAGNPRTWVRVGNDNDTPLTHDDQIFTQRTNDGHAFGTNGPFVTVVASAPNGNRAMIGEVLESDGETVTIDVEVQVPLWMSANRVTLYGNVLDSAPPAGEEIDTPPDFLDREIIVWTAADETGPIGLTLDGTWPATARTRTVSFEVPPGEADGFYTIVVDADESAKRSSFPVLWGNSSAFAFTNPIYVDLDGDGWDAPGAIPAPLIEGGSAGWSFDPPKRPMTREDFEVLRDEVASEHEGH